MSGVNNYAKISRTLILLALWFCLPAGFAKIVTIGWDANTEPDLGGYNVYFGEVGQEPQRLTVSQPEVTLNLTFGRTYFFYVTAYNLTGVESAPSETITYRVPVPSSGIAQITKSAAGINLELVGYAGRVYRVLAATDVTSGDWLEIGQVTVSTTGVASIVDAEAHPHRFYRLEQVYTTGSGDGPVSSTGFR